MLNGNHRSDTLIPRSQRPLESGDLNVHARLDASQMFNKDLLLCENDIYRVPDEPPEGQLHFSLFASIKIKTRLLPLTQIGVRKASFSHKLRKYRHVIMLASVFTASALEFAVNFGIGNFICFGCDPMRRAPQTPGQARPGPARPGPGPVQPARLEILM